MIKVDLIDWKTTAKHWFIKGFKVGNAIKDVHIYSDEQISKFFDNIWEELEKQSRDD